MTLDAIFSGQINISCIFNHIFIHHCTVVFCADLNENIHTITRSQKEMRSRRGRNDEKFTNVSLLKAIFF